MDEEGDSSTLDQYSTSENLAQRRVKKKDKKASAKGRRDDAIQGSYCETICIDG